MLAGVVNAPSRLAPTRNLAAARAPRRLVLHDDGRERLHHRGASARAVRPARVRLGPRDNVPTGTYFADWVLPEASDRADEGYGQRRIRTTLEGDLQRAAVRAVRRAGLGRTQAALVAMRLDGRVVAMVGGRDYAREPVQPRHPGAPPARLGVQALRLSRRLPRRLPARTRSVNDAPIRLGDWSPRNYGERYRGAITAARRGRHVEQLGGGADCPSGSAATM